MSVVVSVVVGGRLTQVVGRNTPGEVHHEVSAHVAAREGEHRGAAVGLRSDVRAGSVNVRAGVRD